MKKRILSLLLALVMCLGLLPAAVSAEEDGETSVTNSDFVIEDGVLTKYQGSDRDVTIPDGVTSIGRYAFFRCNGLTTVTISGSVTFIDEFAFCDCPNLTTITVPATVTRVLPGWVSDLSVTVYFGGTQAQWDKIAAPSTIAKTPINIYCQGTQTARVAFVADMRIISSKTVIVGENYGELPDLPSFFKGVALEGWYTDYSCSTKVTSDTKVTKTSDHDLYANLVWTGEIDPNQVTVRFDSMGGSFVSDKDVIIGQPYGELPTPTAIGHAFEGWYTSAAGGTRVTSTTTVSIEEGHTLYAHWIKADGKLTISHSSVIFDKVQKGYTQPAARTVTVTNIGDAEIVLFQPSSGNFETTKLSETILAPNASATFTIRPLPWLKPGTYSDTITVQSSDGKTKVSVFASFTVEGESSEIPETPSIPASSFTDVPNWAKEAVDWAVAKKITNGTSKGKFSPNDTCTTAHILTFLYRAKGAPAVTIANPFTDVKVSDYFYGPAVWAAEQGLVSGNTLDPNAPCTRSAVVTYLWKLAGSPAVQYDNRFTDVAANAEYAQAVAWAVANNVTNGMSRTTFAPANTCTRGQIVTFLYRAYK